MSQIERPNRRKYVKRGSMDFLENSDSVKIPKIQNTERKPLGDLTNRKHVSTTNLSYAQAITTDKSLSRITNTSNLQEYSSSNSVINLTNVSKRNERERNRVKLLNMGFDRLRAVVPCRSGEQLSKISTLKKAIWYIEHLDKVLHGQERPRSDSSVGIIEESQHCARPTNRGNSKVSAWPTNSAGIIKEHKQDERRPGTSWSTLRQNEPQSTTRRSAIEPIFPTHWESGNIVGSSSPLSNQDPVNLTTEKIRDATKFSWDTRLGEHESAPQIDTLETFPYWTSTDSLSLSLQDPAYTMQENIAHYKFFGRLSKGLTTTNRTRTTNN